MSQHYRCLIGILLATVIGASLLQFASAMTRQFTVPGGREEPRPLDLAVDDHVIIKATFLGQTEHGLHFYITCPNRTERDFGTVGSVDYKFVCTDAGQYVMHFSNVASPQDKLVTIDVEIEHYLFGMPQMLFLVIVIVVICMAAVAVFVLMGKTH